MSTASLPNPQSSDLAARQLAERLDQVRNRIAAAAAGAGRRPEDITLVAVSKTHDADAVCGAIAAGQLVFGENRVQEAAGKFPALRAAAPGLRLHLIGPLQTNKVRDAVKVADVIETLDRRRLADALTAAQRQGDTLPSLLIQVNVGEEPQKAGIPPAEADSFIQDCRDRFGSLLAGLMCIPPADEDPVRHFGWLADRAARHGLPVVSMGMSGDYELAIRHGATHVRVGTAIFGTRPKPEG
jgi:pyridoxal phosphate enzyme (YggS family)